MQQIHQLLYVCVGMTCIIVVIQICLVIPILFLSMRMRIYIARGAVLLVSCEYFSVRVAKHLLHLFDLTVPLALPRHPP